jgi:hypothetical protein
MSADPPLDNDLLTPSLAWPRQSDSGFSDTAPGGRQSHQQLESYDEGVDNREVTNDTQKAPQTNLQQVQSRNINDRGNGRPIRGLTKREVEEVSGSLKVHIKLNLEVDVRVTASLNGDLVIGIL